MKNYSIVRVGSDYVVQAEEKSILKIASRRMAVRLVAEASLLLASSAADPPRKRTRRHQSPVIGSKVLDDSRRFP